VKCAFHKYEMYKIAIFLMLLYSFWEFQIPLMCATGRKIELYRMISIKGKHSIVELDYIFDQVIKDNQKEKLHL